MQINKTTGLLDDCTQCLSPNRDTRPDDTPIDLIVVHSISLPPGEYLSLIHISEPTRLGMLSRMPSSA